MLLLKRGGDNTAYISGIVLYPHAQGKGFGRKILKHILDLLSEKTSIDLVTHPENTRALALYTSLGFEVTERKENYWGEGEPRLVLIRKQK